MTLMDGQPVLSNIDTTPSTVSPTLESVVPTLPIEIPAEIQVADTFIAKMIERIGLDTSKPEVFLSFPNVEMINSPEWKTMSVEERSAVTSRAEIKHKELLAQVQVENDNAAARSYLAAHKLANSDSINLQSVYTNEMFNELSDSQKQAIRTLVETPMVNE